MNHYYNNLTKNNNKQKNHKNNQNQIKTAKLLNNKKIKK